MAIASISLNISGLGIIMYSAPSVSHIRLEEDYLEGHYLEPEDVLRHVCAGTLVGFGTASPGKYILEINRG